MAFYKIAISSNNEEMKQGEGRGVSVPLCALRSAVFDAFLQNFRSWQHPSYIEIFQPCD
jgi:hypothetical protein